MRNWVLHLFTFLLTFSCFALSLTSCSRTGNVEVSKRVSLYDRVMQTGTIRCGYVLYQPFSIKDPNTGKLSGVGNDALELVAKNLGLKIEYTEEVGWGTMIEGLQQNRYDIIVSPIWPNSNRARLVDFSDPLCFSPVFAYVKAGDKRFANNLESINSEKIKIATIDGETAEVIARNDFPKAQKESLPQLADYSQVLLSVSTGKADVSFAEPGLVALFLKHNPGTLVNIAPANPVRVFPNCWMFNRGEMEFKNMLNTALSEAMNSGAIEKIIRKYEPAPNAIYRVAYPYRAPVASVNMTAVTH